jgi:hypothetical protein
MFLNNSNAGDSPTIEPLRIYKGDSSPPEPRTASAASQRSGAGKPSPYQLPPGASSSPAPLPYPDDRPSAGQNSYPDRLNGARKGSATSSPPISEPSRSSIPEYPSALRPRDGRDAGPPLQTSRLAERRGNVPKPLPDSPGPDTPEKEGLFQRLPQRSDLASPNALPSGARPTVAPAGPAFNYQQHYYPPPDEPSSAPLGLIAPNPVNRLASTASNATTRAQRGSPPPPETPILPPDDTFGGGIEARYAAAGIAGPGTLTGLQAQGLSAAAAQRAGQYGGMPPRQQTTPQNQQQEPPRRPWTPTELPGSTPHGPPTIFQGASTVPISPAPLPAPTPMGGSVTSPVSSSGRSPVTTALEQDFQRLQASGSPPPAYSSVSQGRQGSSGGPVTYPNEKGRPVTGPSPAGVAAGVAAGAAAGVALHDESPHQGHPAFANDARQSQAGSVAGSQVGSLASPQFAHAPSVNLGAGPASPPPLPEGWIAHMDPSSGQYYYIHLPTQSTQWEFPKGPTPLNLNEPTSPSVSMYSGNPLLSPGLGPYGKQPLASPGFMPLSPGFMPATPGYAESVMSFGSATPTVTGFTGPPPSSGVDVYKVAPTNGVYFGPYLRYTNMDLERGLWLGSILLVTDAPQPPTIHIHQSTDLSPNPRQLKASPIHRHQRWTFYRYDVDLKMEKLGGAKWTYAITSHLGCTRYEFLVAGLYENSWRFIATSGNDFSLNVGQNERNRVGGIGFMWKDIMAKHVECGGFHVQLGLGNQIYADRLWKEIPLLKQWLAISGKENRKNEPWTARHEEDVTHAYFHYYTSHFDQPYLREAFAQIPHILQIDDHDM